ncbi:hypothetical protein [Flavobacterium tructae]|uniref:Uncharacterized protein n=1 Tax=Flavobacterium tructae TaxID=1114873 RepID=A0A1S1J5Z2_9FLAO|nr:hypothetical protein [Flavobacterium tructae]OHT44994.1 hypothetical protein BHE19_09775 [Flavobacterium tructae]OXB16655.1 hypothetical protein B0A71_19525 [Flavobacterium tructae]OXB25084.1 hypothetical protein B0A80_02315 [Flavobacterium tructae]
MDITLQIKEINGNTNFKQVTLKISNTVEGDFFDMSGNYLGSTKRSKKEIYILGRDFIKNPYSRTNLPKGFYDKQVSFDGRGNIVNIKVGGQYGTIITDLSMENKLKIAEKIFNHYYTEAGFSLNELKYKTITNADDLDRHLDKAEIQRRNSKYTEARRFQLEGTGFAITRIGGYTDYSEYLKKFEGEISICYSHLGSNFDTGYDIMSICAHEHKHLEDCIKDLKNNTTINSENRAYTHQTLVDKNWPFVSFRFKAGMYFNTPASSNMYKDDFKKAFGKHDDYQEFIEYVPGKNITL